MIQLTKLNGAVVFVNPDLIRLIERAPDTILAFADSETLAVRETPDVVREKIIEYRRACARGPAEESPAWTR